MTKICKHCGSKQPYTFLPREKCCICSARLDTEPEEKIYAAGGIYSVPKTRLFHNLVKPSKRICKNCRSEQPYTFLPREKCCFCTAKLDTEPEEKHYAAVAIYDVIRRHVLRLVKPSKRICKHCGSEQPYTFLPRETCCFCKGTLDTEPKEEICEAVGNYPRKKDSVFYLVKPSAKDALPHIARNPDKFYSAIRQHGHLYRVICANTLILEKESPEAEGVGAPEQPQLPIYAIKQLIEALRKRRFVC